MNNEIYLRRSKKIVIEPGTNKLPTHIVAALLKNIEPLGYTFSPVLIELLHTLSVDQITAFYEQLVPDLRKMVGAHREWKPMYPNFPQQVLEMGEAELYINAIIHYLTNALPVHEIKARLPLFDKTAPKIVELGTLEDFEAIFTRLAASKTSWSPSDAEDVAWFVEHHRDDIFRLMPEDVPLKENVALLGASLVRHTTRSIEFLAERIKTATDVLRLAVALSGGDVSLAKPAKFVTFSRPQRRVLLGLLERCPNAIEDMHRWSGRWLRLGEKLHAGEMKRQYPSAFAAFDILRNKKPFETFNRQAERAIENADSVELLSLLQQRPGDFARRLDHALRLHTDNTDEILERFKMVAVRVSTPVLLQLLTHLKHRNAVNDQALRTFFPKGQVGKVQAIKNTLPELPVEVCEVAISICETALIERFCLLEPLGGCFLDETLRNYNVPFSQRSASKSLRTLVRGSRLPLPVTDTLRFFVWWKDGKERTDIDLSAALYDTDFNYRDVISYYNLKSYGGHHSGDIVSAPKGAAEFIDVSLEKLLEKSIRYIVMSINSYTEQPFCDLPECFAGWMARQHPNSGEIFEARTVQDRIDIASDTRICLPLIIDIVERQVVWTDIALKKFPLWNNVANNLGGVSLMTRAMTSLVKPNLYDLFDLHIRARGKRVEDPALATTVFSVETGITPFDGDVITSQWL